MRGVVRIAAFAWDEGAYLACPGRSVTRGDGQDGGRGGDVMDAGWAMSARGLAEISAHAEETSTTASCSHKTERHQLRLRRNRSR